MSHMGSISMYKSAQIVSNCRGLVNTVDDKHQLKADICRYLESVPMNMLTIPDGVELICLIQQEPGRIENSLDLKIGQKSKRSEIKILAKNHNIPQKTKFRLGIEILFKTKSGSKIVFLPKIFWTKLWPSIKLIANFIGSFQFSHQKFLA